jgi:hypothetical protein
MDARSIASRLAFVAVALGALSGWKLVLDGSTQRTRQKLDIHYQIVELYRKTYGELPSPDEYLEFKATVIPDRETRNELATDGWGRSFLVCRYGKKLVLLSRGPDGVNNGGGVDDLSIEIEP